MQSCQFFQQLFRPKRHNLKKLTMWYFRIVLSTSTLRMKSCASHLQLCRRQHQVKLLALQLMTYSVNIVGNCLVVRMLNYAMKWCILGWKLLSVNTVIKTSNWKLTWPNMWRLYMTRWRLTLVVFVGRSSDLTTHQLVHSGAREHECRLCDKKFGRSDLNT